MYSVYLFQQRHPVIVFDDSLNSNSGEITMPYTKNIKVHKGVNNSIIFDFINQNNKPVDITGSTFMFNIISADGTTLLYRKALSVLSAISGRAKVEVPSPDLDLLDAQLASWSIIRNIDSSPPVELPNTTPVFTDAYYGGRGSIDILDSVLPEFAQNSSLTIPTRPQLTEENPNRHHTGAAYREGYFLTSFQLSFENFSGAIKAQGSSTQLGPWYDIGLAKTYVNQTFPDYFNVQGYHNYIRFEINQYGYGSGTGTASVNGNGAVTGVTVAGGSEWNSTANPNVIITGLGTGAKGTATVANGIITGVNVTSGGSGYVAPANVYVNNGFVTSIVYR